ncbi:MAG: hypothetical protein J0L87_08695 [Bacteroidetes bacterium]|nr:hypothetical protein [Bacteroidota bacterium]
MKKILFTFCLILLVKLSIGQKLVASSQLFKNEEHPIPLKNLGSDNDFFYFLMGKGDNLKVEKFSKDSLNRVYSKDISLDKERDVKLKDAFFVNGSSLVFRQDYDGTAEQITLFMQVVKDDGKVESDLKEIFSFKSKLKRYYYDSHSKVWDNLIYYHFSLSPDKNYLAIIAEEYFWDGRDMNFKKIHLKYLNTQKHNIVLEKTIPMQYETTKVHPWNYKIDNSQNVYFCMNYYNQENKLQYAIGSVTKDGSSIIAMDHVLNTARHAYFDMDYVIDSSVIFSSLLYSTVPPDRYGNDKNYTRFMGLSTSCFNLSDYKLISSDSAHFSDEMIKRIYKNRFNKIDGYYRISGITAVKGNYYTIVSEDRLKMKGSIIVFKNGLDNKIKWSRLLFREYEVDPYDYDSKDYIHFVNTANNISIIYGENKSAIKIRTEELSLKKSNATSEGNASLVCATIDSDGNIERKTLLNSKLNTVYHVDRKGIEVDRFVNYSKIMIKDNEQNYIFFFAKKNKFQFHKFSFK